MSVDNPDLWKTALDYLWAIVLIPLKMIWTKADNACTKAELEKAMQAFDKRADELRATTVILFTNAEHDRRTNREDLAKVQNEMHKAQLTLLSEIRSCGNFTKKN